ncbi:uncharacterized protein DC041_0011243, partial [Schistosoma bovis]
RISQIATEIGRYNIKGKSNIFRYNTKNTNAITLDEETLEGVETFTYLGSVIDEQGRSDADLRARIGKAGTASLQTFNTNIKIVLLYGAEASRTTTTIIKMRTNQLPAEEETRKSHWENPERKRKRGSKTWYQCLKSLTSNLSHVGRYRLLDCVPRDYLNRPTEQSRN